MADDVACSIYFVIFISNDNFCEHNSKIKSPKPHQKEFKKKEMKSSSGCWVNLHWTRPNIFLIEFQSASKQKFKKHLN